MSAAQAVRAARAAGVLACAYLASGVAAMWWLSPRVPYADAWRFLGHFLAAPFPRDILAPDNGHHEVLPNALRVLELHAFAAGQWLQVVAGIALALATTWTFWRAVRGLQAPAARAAALLAVVLGMFWLGNVRALAHGNESVHAYLVTLFLALGVHALARADAGRRGTGMAALAALCGLAASFSFGSGPGVFAGFAAVLLLRRAPLAQWLVLGGGALLALALLRLDGGGASIRVAPLRQAELLLRWLSGPFVYAAWPLLDPQVAGQVPVAVARVPAQALAAAYEDAFGPALLARWPQLALGAGGLAWGGWLLRRARRSGAAAAPATLAGIALACFAAATGAMIALVRLPYFEAHPDQLLAPRYVVWSSLFWTGLLLATAAQARRPARAAWAVVVVAVALVPSQLWMGRLGAGMRAVAEQAALAAAVGVVEPGLPLGETVPAELAAALPPLREAGAAMFAWPEARLLGTTPAAIRLLPARDLEVAAVDNRLGERGRRVRFALDGVAAERLLLLEPDGAVRGLALRARDGEGRWIGWMQGAATTRAPRVAVLAAP